MHRSPDQLNSGMLPESPARFVRVIIDRAIHRELDYAVPEGLSERVAIGSRLRVPFRDKSSLATVVRILEETEVKGLREIEAVVGDAPALSPPLLELAKWMSDYYCCPIEPVIRSLLPQVVRKGEVGWKKQLFVHPPTAIASELIEKLRKRAPRQAELLEAIAKLPGPVAASDDRVEGIVVFRQAELTGEVSERKLQVRVGTRLA